MQFQKLLSISIPTVLDTGTGYSEGKEASSWVVETPIRTAYDRKVKETLIGFTYKS
jgi:hypothetical protein